MEQSCSHCDQPDSSLLRIVLIGEMIQAEDTTLYAMAEALQSLGLLDLATEDDVPETQPRAQSPRGKNRLRLVK